MDNTTFNDVTCLMNISYPHTLLQHSSSVMPLRRMFSRRLVDVKVELYGQSDEGSDVISDVITGPVYSVDTGVVDLADRGSKLVPIFGDSALTLHVASECPLGHHIKHLGKINSWTSGAVSDVVMYVSQGLSLSL